VLADVGQFATGPAPRAPGRSWSKEHS
jgi:hypothetical protein